MKLAILSRAPRAYSTQRLRTAALDRGHQVKVLNTLRFAIDLSGEEPDLQFRGRQLTDYDAVLPRIGNSITYFGTAVVRQFEQMDVYTPNTAYGITNSRDKLRATQILSRHNIGMPATTFVRDRADVIPAIERVGGAPVVIKLLEGTQGIGVILAPELKVAEAIIETLQSTKQNVLIQRFVKESKGRDIRALVVGDRVVAAMRRVARGDEFRSNVHRGGTVEPVELPEEYERVAVRAAQIMGLRIAGVDMLEGNEGPLVMEVNSSPGLEGIEAATKLDVAGAIIDYIDNQVAFPQIDVRERLSVSTGYGVAELVVHGDAELVGKPLGESGLRERDITVLTLHRGTTVVPNPFPAARAGGGGPAAVLRQARGDAVDDPRPPEAPGPGQEAPQAPDPRLLSPSVGVMTSVAFIGLGSMGQGMASCLLAAGHDLVVFNRTPTRADALVARGARRAATPREAADGADIVVVMVSDDDASRAVWLGEDGILASSQKEGALAIECSTLSHGWVVELDDRVRRAGRRYLDCPVTGLPDAAAEGRLTLLVGGDPTDVAEAQDVLDALATDVVRFGPVGAGTAYKLMINLMGAVQIAALAEGLALAERAGLDLEHRREGDLDEPGRQPSGGPQRPAHGERRPRGPGRLLRAPATEGRPVRARSRGRGRRRCALRPDRAGAARRGREHGARRAERERRHRGRASGTGPPLVLRVGLTRRPVSRETTRRRPFDETAFGHIRPRAHSGQTRPHR